MTVRGMVPPGLVCVRFETPTDYKATVQIALLRQGPNTVPITLDFFVVPVCFASRSGLHPCGYNSPSLSESE